MAKNYYISEFAIEKEIYELLKNVSKEMDMTMTSVIRFILRKTLQNMLSQLRSSKENIFFPEIKAKVET